jgi:hypothetical protein
LLSQAEVLKMKMSLKHAMSTPLPNATAFLAYSIIKVCYPPNQLEFSAW